MSCGEEVLELQGVVYEIVAQKNLSQSFVVLFVIFKFSFSERFNNVVATVFSWVM